MKQKIQIVILTAGYGSRLRPLTWSKPKPLVAIAGRTSLDYLLDEFKDLGNDWDPEYIFVISPNGWSIKTYMEENYPGLNCKYVVQEEMKGQSHAIYCAKDLIDSPMIMTFADTLIHVDLSCLKDETRDGLAWCQYTEDPRRFGAAVLDETGRVKHFIEKPPTMEHKMVIVGFYYFKDGRKLISAIEEQIEKNISLKNEFYIADGINIMLDRGDDFGIQETNAWVDAGVPGTVISTNRFFLDQGNDNSAEAAKREGVVIIPPVYVDPTAVVERSVIGPYVSIAAGCKVTNCVLQDTILDKRTNISGLVAHETMLGADVDVTATDRKLFLGDNCKAEL
ncbi:MAG: NTP transferase domain-containing protein [Anaerolineaceae bacterium]|nr:NTP transferase domain-containing protein [Anaerolineaceae bacterium]